MLLETLRDVHLRFRRHLQSLEDQQCRTKVPGSPQDRTPTPARRALCLQLVKRSLLASDLKLRKKGRILIWSMTIQKPDWCFFPSWLIKSLTYCVKKAALAHIRLSDYGDMYAIPKTFSSPVIRQVFFQVELHRFHCPFY